VLRTFGKQKEAITVTERGNNRIGITVLSVKENLKLVFKKYKVQGIITLQPSVRKQRFIGYVACSSHFVTVDY
jgi:hypothetical protein